MIALAQSIRNMMINLLILSGFGGYSIFKQTTLGSKKKKNGQMPCCFEVPKRQQTCEVKLRYGSWPFDPNGFQVAWNDMTIVQIGRGSYEKSANLIVQHMAPWHAVAL